MSASGAALKHQRMVFAGLGFGVIIRFFLLE
jgi:hypothetical protein